MLGEGGTPLSRLLAAARDFQAREDRRVDLKGLRAVIDLLEGEFAGEACAMKRSGEQLVAGNISAASRCNTAQRRWKMVGSSLLR